MSKHAIGPEAPALPRYFYWVWLIGVVPTTIYLLWAVNHTYQATAGADEFWFFWAVFWVLGDLLGAVWWFRTYRRDDYELLKPYVQAILLAWVAYRAFERHEDKRMERAFGRALDQRGLGHDPGWEDIGLFD